MGDECCDAARRKGKGRKKGSEGRFWTDGDNPGGGGGGDNYLLPSPSWMFASFSVEMEDRRHESADAAPIVSDRTVSESRSTICFTFERGQ